MNNTARERGRWQRAKFAYDTLIAPWPPYTLYLCIIALFGACVPLIQIYVTTNLVDALVAHVDPGADLLTRLKPYASWILLLVGCLMLHQLLYMASFQHYMAARLNEAVRERFDRLFFEKALSLPLESFEHPETYDRMTRAYQAIHTLTSGSARPLYNVQRLITCTVGALAILWALAEAHWALPPILLLGGIAMMRHSIAEERAFIRITYRQTPLQRRQTYWRSLLTERASAAEMRLFDLTGHILSVWGALIHRLIDERASARWRYVHHTTMAMAILVLVYTGALITLLYLASQGTLSAGKLVAFFYAIHYYLFFLHNNGSRMAKIQSFLSELHYAQDFLSHDAKEKNGGLKPAQRFQTGIRFENVTYAYPGNASPVLTDIRFHLRPGERIALVGVNGAGKTTLVKLLLGLYRPTTGRILVDGVDLQTFDPKTWRSRTGVVFQDYVRYALTVRENIGFGCLEKLSDLEAIRTAADLADIAERIDALPEGYDTLLGKQFADGQDLSLGQWQKLAIARAYLRDADLLILDEPTSALDALAERDVYRCFTDLSAGKSVILISHRLGSARLADRILFLENGVIAQEGTHDDLMAAGGSYAELYKMQAEWYRR